MRRPPTIAAFVLLTLAVSLAAVAPASAQRGGMRSSGGGHGGAMSRPSGGHASGGHTFVGMRGGMRAGVGSHSSFRGDGFRGTHFRSRGFRRCFGCRRGFGDPWYPGYGFAGDYSPEWWWGSSSYDDYDEDQSRELALANEMDAVNVEQQRLREREEREDRDQDSYTPRSRPRGRDNTDDDPATALVFRDQHVEEVHNYAIAGGTLWVLNQQTAKKIPLTQLDLAATARRNEDRGVDFQVPK